MISPTGFLRLISLSCSRAFCLLFHFAHFLTRRGLRFRGQLVLLCAHPSCQIQRRGRRFVTVRRLENPDFELIGTRFSAIDRNCSLSTRLNEKSLRNYNKAENMSDPIAQLGLNCPAGGSFYICQGNSTQFLGCCTSNPCEEGKGECPQSDLRSSSFNESAYSDIKSQACASTGEWYTCSQLDTPFLGCCSTNACDSGCPTKDLLAAKLSDNTKSAGAFETTSATATASSTNVKSTTTTTASSTATQASSTAAKETVGTHSASASGLSKGAEVGIAVGAAIVILVLLAALFIFGRRYVRKRRGVVVTGSPPSVLMSNPVNSYLYHGEF